MEDISKLYMYNVLADQLRSQAVVEAGARYIMRARHSPKPIGVHPAFRQWARKITSSPLSRKVRLSPDARTICR
jgi:hypothetical protein